MIIFVVFAVRAKKKHKGKAPSRDSSIEYSYPKMLVTLIII